MKKLFLMLLVAGIAVGTAAAQTAIVSPGSSISNTLYWNTAINRWSSSPMGGDGNVQPDGTLDIHDWSHTFNLNAIQSFPVGNNTSTLVLGFTANDLSDPASAGSLYFNSQGLHGNTHFSWYDGVAANTSMTPSDSSCDFNQGCSGDPSAPTVTSQSPSIANANLTAPTADAYNVPQNPTGDFLDLQAGVTTPYIQASPAAGHVKTGYASNNRYQLSNNGGAFSDLMVRSDGISLSPIVNNCGGTVGASNSTAYIFFPASANPVTCTASTTGGSNAEIQVPLAATASHLGAVFGTACTSATTAITLYKNGSATALTVNTLTGSTGTWVNDNTHTVTFSAGDTYSVRIVTGQATETCAGMKAVFFLGQ